ncbi:hypothetical protein JQ634_03895 [Bradyrhizobium sp. AUGA SZCCT0240]|uniref:hypothetical protein n=1 Tax=unclassified Bradyrhizobium TaxID=2631580 RepID=UPI001BA93BB2|nr:MULTISPECIES: hypothetical protein [unclassified Bradyrhizobium]MBR1192071.1 hypothetical protein [Bradyrhizobium sp. AUGA SZCCT0160]MBR1245093.1 hypothetical protein [Bradyrhizobium sp. AUGA SZCCT0274]MBR1251754.1 hypothetical protein [Bradyrhizobium sp. AUGA SZCCT0169]MBR1252836.1 hypothetical protein [Bradyrhizobium sp. AUGA SZCCT0240]
MEKAREVAWLVDARLVPEAVDDGITGFVVSGKQSHPGDWKAFRARSVSGA